MGWRTDIEIRLGKKNDMQKIKNAKMLMWTKGQRESWRGDGDGLCVLFFFFFFLRADSPRENAICTTDGGQGHYCLPYLRGIMLLWHAQRTLVAMFSRPQQNWRVFLRIDPTKEGQRMRLIGSFLTVCGVINILGFCCLINYLSLRNHSLNHSFMNAVT